ncbi:MAG: Stp1/IreP family PP2C-type Ser/Thr phosphatase [Chloroflexi bacterium]|nr:Stp1/IreP family PP2C-type Ser/Thr phosphatase [Chloroflexota bacterium]
MPTKPRVRYNIAKESNVGRVRRNNQDAMGAWVQHYPDRPPLAVLVVADGMGGHEAGEIASQLAVEKLLELLTPAVEGGIQLGEELDAMLANAITQASTAIVNFTVSHKIEPGNMGTTLECAVLMGGEGRIAHVGDSRIYQLTANGLNQVTEDHSAVAELVSVGVLKPEDVYTHPRRNILTRSVGGPWPLEVDMVPVSLKVGDRLMLCSDGLWGLVRDDDIERILLKADPPDRLVQELIEAALEAGGDDNITVILCDVLPA